MSRLLAVELRRIVSRRLVRLLVLGIFVTLTITSVLQGFNHTNDLGAARQKIVADVTRQAANGGFGVRCEGNGSVGPMDVDPSTGQVLNLPPNCHNVTVDEEVGQRIVLRYYARA